MKSQLILIAKCPICGSGDPFPFLIFPELNWVKCKCGLIYKQSESPDSVRSDFYEDTYFGVGLWGRRYTQRTRRRITKSRNQILDMLNFAPRARLLDIGCSMGYTLTAARELDLDCAGCDLSRFAVQACRERGFQAEIGELCDIPFHDGDFGLITMKHVLEHTPNPESALAEVRRLLKIGGAIFIAVPHAGYRKSIRAPRSSRFYLPDAHGREHFIYYTPELLKRLLHKQGFRVVSVNPVLVHRAVPLPRRIFETLFSPIRWLAQLVAEKFSLRKEFWIIAIRD